MIRKIVGLAAMVLCVNTFASTQMPQHARTELILQNNTSGALHFDLSAMHIANVKGDNLSPALPQKLAGTNYTGIIKQGFEGIDYDVNFPVMFPDGRSKCLVHIHYDAANSVVSASALPLDVLAKSETCSATVDYQGFLNAVTVSMITD